VNIDPEKLFVLFVIAVLVLGPERLPQAARTLGRALAEVRKYTSSMRSEVDRVLAEPRAVVDAAVHEAEMRAQAPRSTNGAPAPPAPRPATEPLDLDEQAALPSSISAPSDMTAQAPFQALTAPRSGPGRANPDLEAGPDDPSLN
jgi:sec-independent protein translocase protein TatB